MKLIIAGSRHMNVDITFIQNCIDILIDQNIIIDEVVCGGCKGIDVSGKNWAEFQHIPIKKFPADWDKYGKLAGPKRNAEMAEYADALLLIWDGKSRGSFNMRINMWKLKKPIYEVILSNKDLYEESI